MIFEILIFPPFSPLFTGGHKEFSRRHREHCEDSAPLALSPPPPQDPDIESHPPSRVLPFLYVGNARDAKDLDLLKDLGVTRVLNVTLQATIQLSGSASSDGNVIAYRQLPASDSTQQNIKQYFEEAFSFIGEFFFFKFIVYISLKQSIIISNEFD